MVRLTTVIMLLMTWTLGGAIKCYYCGGYSSSMPDSAANTRYCADGSFEKKKVELYEGVGSTCVKRVSYTFSGERFVQRYIGGGGVVKRSLDDSTLSPSNITTHIPNGLDPLSHHVGDLPEEDQLQLDLESIGQSPVGQLQLDPEGLPESRLDDPEHRPKDQLQLDLERLSKAPVDDGVGRKSRSVRNSNDEYYYCSKDKCNSAPKAMVGYLVTLMPLAAILVVLA